MDWIAGILELTGAWQVGSKNRYGFIITMSGSLCWVAYVLFTGNAFGLLIVVIPSLFINIRNFIRWKPGSGYKHTALSLRDTIR